MSVLDRAIVRAYSQATPQQAAPSGGRLESITAEVSESVPEAPLSSLLQPTVAEVASAVPAARHRVKVETSLSWSWPRIVQQLLNQAEFGFIHLAQQLAQASLSRRKKTVAFTSAAQGEGCTSILLTIAQILARQKELRILILEANPGHPTHVDLLQMRGECVRSISITPTTCQNPGAPWNLTGTRISVLPLFVGSHPDQSAWQNSVIQNIPCWRDDFDLILLDIGPFPQRETVSQLWWSTVTDRVISITSSSRLSSNPQGLVDDREWELAGIESLGLIETFA